MKIRIRKGDVTKDQEAIVSFLRKHLTPESSLARFTWLYQECPFGRAKVWLAHDENSGEMIGLSAAFPRRMSIDREDRLCWVLGDFCIHPSCRSLGPALMLQKACFQELELEEGAFIYDFPSKSMMAIYKRLGAQPSGLHVRFVRPLRLDRKIRAVLGSNKIARGLVNIGNLALKVSQWGSRFHEGIVAIHRGKCGEEFSALYERGRSQGFIGTMRTADYLNWRFQRNPLEHFDIWTLRQGDVLKGYLVALKKGESARIVDVFFDRNHEIVKQLVVEASESYRRQGIQSLEFNFPESHPFNHTLKHLHFIKREGCSVMVYGKHNWNSNQDIFGESRWWLTTGDRDS